VSANPAPPFAIAPGAKRSFRCSGSARVLRTTTRSADRQRCFSTKEWWPSYRRESPPSGHAASMQAREPFVSVAVVLNPRELAPQSIRFALECVASSRWSRVGVLPLSGRGCWPQGQLTDGTPLSALEALEHARTAVLVAVALPEWAALSVSDLEPAQPAEFVS
jgi:hypothetical protein